MNFTRQINVKDLGKYERQLAQQLPRVVTRLQQQGARASIGILQRNVRSIRPYPPVDSKRYLLGFEVQRGPRNSVIVTNNRGYASVIEEGRRAGARRPPSSALVGWVQRKLGVPPKRARGVAFAVARKIGKYGIRAKRVVTSAMPEINRKYLQIMFDANDRMLSGRRV